VNAYNEYAEFRSAVQKLVRQEIAPIAARIEDDDSFPVERFLELFGDMGLLQILVPEQYGGPGSPRRTGSARKERRSNPSCRC
jgi:alkylation response protein AidB-like acyl-CoA dehydrogenase